MAYGLSTRVFVEGGPVEQVARLDNLRSTARTWHALSDASRLAAIDRALHAANDRMESFPIAL
jgi:hypothetical protein